MGVSSSRQEASKVMTGTTVSCNEITGSVDDRENGVSDEKVLEELGYSLTKLRSHIGKWIKAERRGTKGH